MTRAVPRAGHPALGTALAPLHLHIYIADDNQNSNPSASSPTTMRKAHPNKISPVPTFLDLLPVGIKLLIGDPGMLKLAG